MIKTAGGQGCRSLPIFRFDPPPATGLLLMWQRPIAACFPPEVVEIAIKVGIRLAHHVDVEMAQWRLPVGLDWLDWLIGRPGSSNMPRTMHVEGIV
jgi:hypothetical protein